MAYCHLLHSSSGIGLGPSSLLYLHEMIDSSLSLSLYSILSWFNKHCSLSLSLATYPSGAFGHWRGGMIDMGVAILSTGAGEMHHRGAGVVSAIRLLPMPQSTVMMSEGIVHHSILYHLKKKKTCQVKLKAELALWPELETYWSTWTEFRVSHHWLTILLNIENGSINDSWRSCLCMV